MKAGQHILLGLIWVAATIACAIDVGISGPDFDVEGDASLQWAEPTEEETASAAPGRFPDKDRPPRLGSQAAVKTTPTPAGRPGAQDGTGAAGVEILESEMGTGVPPLSIDIQEPKEVFRPEEEVYITLWTRVEGPDEVSYRSVWTGPDRLIWMEEVSTVGTGETGWYLGGYVPPSGWDPGQYTVELFFANELAATWTFEVLPKPTPEPSSGLRQSGVANRWPSTETKFTDSGVGGISRGGGPGVEGPCPLDPSLTASIAPAYS